MVVIGIAVAAIAVNLATDPRHVLAAEAERLALLLQQARDEAMTTGTAVAFSADDRGYRFWQRQPLSGPQDVPVAAEGAWPGAGWKAHPDVEVFRPRQLPAALTLGDLRLSGQIAPREARRIVFSPSGVAPPFRIELAAGEYRADVAGDAMGNIHAE